MTDDLSDPDAFFGSILRDALQSAAKESADKMIAILSQPDTDLGVYAIPPDGAGDLHHVSNSVAALQEAIKRNVEVAGLGIVAKGEAYQIDRARLDATGELVKRDEVPMPVTIIVVLVMDQWRTLIRYADGTELPVSNEDPIKTADVTGLAHQMRAVAANLPPA